jgi:NAD(P)H-dependent FMN reductase
MPLALSKMAKIALITTSTRKPRVGPSVTAYVKSVFEPKANDVELSTVDVVDFKLPIFDEASLPAMVPAKAEFAHEHSKAWTAEISKYDAYVLLSPEYNFGIPGGTKNAIDFLYHAWIGKPVLIVTYGIMGATNASEQLKTVLTGMKLNVCETRPSLSFENGNLGPDLWAAAGEGKLGDGTKALWEKEKKEELLKGFGELIEALKRPPQPTSS